MSGVRGITVCVGDWYAATLAVCLVRNMRHLTSCVVVTAPGQHEVTAVVRGVPGVTLFETDAFTRPDANGVTPHFNKGLALEEGFDFMGRYGRILIWDADILFPDFIPWDAMNPGHLCGATRRILNDPTHWSPALDWRRCPVVRDGGPIGFFQCFDASDPAVKDKRPWYDVSFAHAGGGDAYFLTHWPRLKWQITALEVLHLGPRDTHWFGCDPAGRDVMAAFVTRNGWNRSHSRVDRTAVTRVGEITERVDVPGYEPSTFELPFVRRARTRGG